MKTPFKIKICPRCKNILVANSLNFGISKHRKDGFNPWCRNCIRDINKMKRKDAKKTMEFDYRKNDKIICLNTLSVYKSIFDIHDIKEFGLDGYLTVYDCCIKKRKYAGRINNKRAIWMYYEDYLKLTTEDIYGMINKKYKKRQITVRGGYKKVILLNTKELFDSTGSACSMFNISDVSIYRCCGGNSKGECRYAGIINGERAIWMYYEDYLKLTTVQVEDIKNKVFNRDKKEPKKKIYPSRTCKVICLDNLNVYNNARHASERLSISEDSIINCCIGKQKYADDKNKWVFFKGANFFDVDLNSVIYCE